ncbi:hypothetical protein SLE2022_340550 [Rubroshorea leprosula]
MAGIDDKPQELMRVLLATAPEVLCKNPEPTLDRNRLVLGEIHAEGAHNLFLKQTERTVALPIGVGSRIARRRVLIPKAEIGKRRCVSEALKNAVEVAGVAEVP